MGHPRAGVPARPPVRSLAAPVLAVVLLAGCPGPSPESGAPPASSASHPAPAPGLEPVNEAPAASRRVDAGAAAARETGEPVRLDPPALPGSAGPVTWSPDGAALAVGDGPYLSLIDTATGQPRWRFESSLRRALQASFSGDGRTLAVTFGSWSAGNSTVDVFSLTDGRRLCHIEDAHYGGTSLDAAGRTLFEPAHNAIWDVTTCTERFAIDLGGDSAGGIALSPDGRTLALITTRGRRLHLVDTATTDLVAALDARPRAGDGDGLDRHSLAWSLDSRWIATLQTGSGVHVWDVERRRLARVLSGRLHPRATIAGISPSGGSITLVVEDTFEPWTLALDLDTGRERLRSPPEPHPAYAVVPAPDLRATVRVAVGAPAPAELHTAGGARVLLPDLSTWDGPPIHFAPDGERFALHGARAPVEIRDSASGALIHALPAGQRGLGQALHVALGPDGSTAAVSGDGGIRIWDLRTGQVLRRIDFEAYRLSLGAPGTLVAAGGNKPRLQVWDLASGGLRRSFPLPDAAVALATSPSATRVAALTRGALAVWDIASGTPVATLEKGLPEPADTRDLWFRTETEIVIVGTRGNLSWDVASATARVEPLSLQTLAGDSGFPFVSGGTGVTLCPRTAHLAPALGEQVPRQAVISPECRIVAVPLHGGPVALLHADDARPFALFAPAFGRDVAFVQSVGVEAGVALMAWKQWAEWLPSEQVEPLGAGASDLLTCRSGPRVLPLDPCEGRFLGHGLLAVGLARGR